MKHYSIGSIVKLKDVDHLFMIAGYLPKIKDGKTFDYFAVTYPFGLISLNEFICINNDIVEKVVFEGYSDEQTISFLNNIEEFEKNLMSIKTKEIPEQ